MEVTLNKNFANVFESMQKSVQDTQLGRRVADNMVVFEDKISPLSLTYSDLFQYDGSTFVSIEHLVLYFKAIGFEDHKAKRQIAETLNAKVFHSIPIKGFNHNLWKKFERKTVETAVAIKFAQVKEAKIALKDTGYKRLVYASRHDTFFGCGLLISDDNVLFPQFWRGQNELGKILENQRKKL